MGPDQTTDDSAAKAVDVLSTLPDELVLAIFRALGDDPRAVASWASTCKRYAAIAGDPLIWRDMYAARFQIVLHERFADFSKDHRWVYQARSRVATCKETRPGAYVIRPYHHRRDTGYAGGVRQWRYYGDLDCGHASGYGVGLPMAAIEKGTISTFDSRPLLARGRYEGEWRHGGPHGSGVHVYANGDRYSGEWVHGQKGGHGTMTWADGRTYKGQWTKNMKDGSGVYTMADGSTYDGEWKEDVRHGRGIYRSAKGWTYDGEWRDDVRCGSGMMWYTDGSTYDGKWWDDVRCGTGTYKSAEGWTYEGTWLRDVRKGCGVMRHPSGWTYDGEWDRDVSWGRGVLHFDNGKVHVGLWQNDQRHGHGVTTTQKAVITGIWQLGVLSQCSIVETSGLRYEGGWADDRGSHGHGVCAYPDGSIIDGTWNGVDCLLCFIVVHPPQDNADECCACMACAVLAKRSHADSAP